MEESIRCKEVAIVEKSMYGFSVHQDKKKVAIVERRLAVSKGSTVTELKYQQGHVFLPNM